MNNRAIVESGVMTNMSYGAGRWNGGAPKSSGAIVNPENSVVVIGSTL
ncbi:hypothetical protein [Paraburkholderia sp. GAS33]